MSSATYRRRELCFLWPRPPVPLPHTPPMSGVLQTRNLAVIRVMPAGVLCPCHTPSSTFPETTPTLIFGLFSFRSHRCVRVISSRGRGLSPVPPVCSAGRPSIGEPPRGWIPTTCKGNQSQLAHTPPPNENAVDRGQKFKHAIAIKYDIMECHLEYVGREAKPPT